MNIYKFIIYLIIAFIFIWRIKSAYKTGFVKEIANAISIAIALAVGLLIKNIVLSFMGARYGNAIAYISVLSVVLIIYKIVSLIMFSLKIFSSLPVIKFINRLLGGVLGIVEAVGIIIFAVELLNIYVL